MSSRADTEAEAPAPVRRGFDRRRLLTVGGASAAAAAVLAACGPSSSRSGESGTTVPADEDTTAATVPGRKPTETEVASDIQQAQTLISIELSAVNIYDRVLGDLTESANSEAAQAFRKQHEDTAAALDKAATSVLGKDATYDQPNEYLDKRVAGPTLDGLESDAKNAAGSAEAEQSAEDAFVRFLMNTEGTLASTYLSAIGLIVTDDFRKVVAPYAAPSARRQAVWGDLIGATVPPDALFSIRDGVPNEALVGAGTGEEAAAGDEGEDGEGDGKDKGGEGSGGVENADKESGSEGSGSTAE